ncbi:uncharacterized protein LOC131671138 [Phymastichus coffea]|uniref:uncharacterized protein LOC131671138 n=1 Tax=Phymastichus coffea TaxID=108790 RepID=UPI00273C6763|nr:uncharacterized protein LOC131671138 [Phymastichus coffea]
MDPRLRYDVEPMLNENYGLTIVYMDPNRKAEAMWLACQYGSLEKIVDVAIPEKFRESLGCTVFFYMDPIHAQVAIEQLFNNRKPFSKEVLGLEEELPTYYQFEKAIFDGNDLSEAANEPDSSDEEDGQNTGLIFKFLNLLNLTLSIEDAFSERKDLLAAFLDIDGAFDNVIIDILLRELSTIGCPSEFVKLVNFISSNRQIYTELTGNKPRIVNKGVAQGGVLSPLLFCIYIAKIINNVPKSVTVSKFADDLAVYCKRLPLQTCKRLIEKAVGIIYQNLRNLGLDLSPSKTVLMHFNNRHVKPGLTEIKIKDTIIKSSESTRFLGIILDYQLNFKNHIKQIHKKASMALNIIKFLRGTWWGAQPGTLLTLYKSFIRAIIDYGCLVYYPTQAKLTNVLEKIQYSAIRLSLGYRISTPTNILLSESKLVTIENRTKYLCLNYLYKIMSNKNFKVFSSFHFGLYEYDYYTLIDDLDINIEFGKTLDKSKDPNSELEKLKNERNPFFIFTDGSKSDNSNSVGCACISEDLNIEIVKSVDKRASIFTAESIALLEAMKLGRRYPTRDVYIFTDSLSALLALKNVKFDIKTNPYILETRKIALDFKLKSPTNSALKFFWIRLHTGLNGNKNADLAAKNVSMSAPSDFVKIPYTDLRQLFKKEAIVNTREFLCTEGNNKGINFFQNFHNEKDKPWFAHVNLPRAIITTINCCRSGHYNLAYSLGRIGIKSSTDCECGHPIQDLDHILWQCPVYDQQRSQFIKDLRKQKMFLPMNSVTLLVNPTADLCTSVYNFVSNCKLQL